MNRYFEIVKYANNKNLRIEVTSDNAYLGTDDVTILSLKDGDELITILEELRTTKYKESDLVYKIGELSVIGILLKYRELFECPFNEGGFDELESKIQSILKLVPFLCVNTLLDDCGIHNFNNLTWHNEFLAPEYIEQYSKLADTLNQSQIEIKTIEDANIFLNIGDILSVIDTDDYYEECYFKPKQVRSKYYYYKELTPIKYEILKNIVSGKTKLLFKDAVIKSEVFKSFLNNLTYTVARLNFKEDLDDEYFSNLHKFTNQLAMAELLS